MNGLVNQAISLDSVISKSYNYQVLQLGLGLNVNLLDSWQPYRAAFTVITNQVDTNKAKDMAAYHYNALSKLTVPQVRWFSGFAQSSIVTRLSSSISLSVVLMKVPNLLTKSKVTFFLVILVNSVFDPLFKGKISPNDFDANIRLVSQYNSSLRWLILHTCKFLCYFASATVEGPFSNHTHTEIPVVTSFWFDLFL